MAGVRHGVTAGPPEARAARRGGILAVVLMPLVAVVGVVLLALSGLTPAFVPAGITLIVLAGIAVGIGVVALRRTGPLGLLRNLAGLVAVVGIVATFVVGALVPIADDAGTSIASVLGATVIIAVTWALAFVIAGTVRKAERADRR